MRVAGRFLRWRRDCSWRGDIFRDRRRDGGGRPDVSRPSMTVLTLTAARPSAAGCEAERSVPRLRIRRSRRPRPAPTPPRQQRGRRGPINLDIDGPLSETRRGSPLVRSLSASSEADCEGVTGETRGGDAGPQDCAKTRRPPRNRPESEHDEVGVPTARLMTTGMVPGRHEIRRASRSAPLSDRLANC